MLLEIHFRRLCGNVFRHLFGVLPIVPYSFVSIRFFVPTSLRVYLGVL